MTLGQMAEYFHYHPNTVTRILKKYAGESFSMLVQDIKMQKACALLHDSQIPVSVIVEDLNYYDQSCFGKAFRKKFHTTPGNYRRLYQKPGE